MRPEREPLTIAVLLCAFLAVPGPMGMAAAANCAGTSVGPRLGISRCTATNVEAHP